MEDTYFQKYLLNLGLPIQIILPLARKDNN